MKYENVDLLRADTGELVSVKKQTLNHFNANFNYIPLADAESNKGDYIVDDSDYIPLEVMIERTKRFSPRDYNDIKNGKYMDTVYLRPEEFRKYYEEMESATEDEEHTETNPEVAGDLEDETGDVAPTQQAKSNPVEVDPTASGNAAVESKE